LTINNLNLEQYTTTRYIYRIVINILKIMGEAKRREELGLPPREKKKEKQTSKNQLNKILNKYPYLPFILGFSLLAILIIDLVNTTNRYIKRG